MSDEVFLDKYLVKGKALTLWFEINMGFELLPLTRSDKGLSEEIDKREHSFEIVYGCFYEHSDAPPSDMVFLA